MYLRRREDEAAGKSSVWSRHPAPRPPTPWTGPSTRSTIRFCATLGPVAHLQARPWAGATERAGHHAPTQHWTHPYDTGANMQSQRAKHSRSLGDAAERRKLSAAAQSSRLL